MLRRGLHVVRGHRGPQVSEGSPGGSTCLAFVGHQAPVGLRGVGCRDPLGFPRLPRGPSPCRARGCSQNGLWALQAARVRRASRASGARVVRAGRAGGNAPSGARASGASGARRSRKERAPSRVQRPCRQRAPSSRASATRAPCKRRAPSGVCTRGPGAAHGPGQRASVRRRAASRRLQPPLPSVESRQLASGT